MNNQWDIPGMLDPDEPIGENEPEQKITSVGVIEPKKKPQKEAFIGYDPNKPSEYDIPGEQPAKKIQEPEEENIYLRISRWLNQVPLGALQMSTYPLDLMLLMGQADALDDEEIRRIEQASERLGIPFDEEKYIAKVQEASSLFPTQSNVEEWIESSSGLPLRPKTKGQKALRFLSEVGKVTPGSVTRKLGGGAVGTATKAGLEAAGVPEEVAGLVGFGVGTFTGGAAPSLKIERKPSGMPKFQFEKIKNTRRVTPARADAIDDAVENAFKKIYERIETESPNAQTAEALRTNPKYKAEVAERFETVNELAKQIKDPIHTDHLKQNILLRAQDNLSKGLTKNEREKAYEQKLTEFYDDLPEVDAPVEVYVEQFRKNNQDLAGHFESGKSSNYNKGKRDALLDYNRAIADLFEQRFPNSEFTKLFKEQNAHWTKINDYEAISEFMDGLFKGKINYKQGKKLFEKENVARPFKRFLGEEGYKEFTQLMEDLLTQEQYRAKVKTGREAGYSDFMRDMAFWMINPKIGALRTGGKYAKHAYNMLLDKPALVFEWRKGLEQVKANDFEGAKQTFEALEAELQIPPEAKEVAPYNPNEGIEIDITPRNRIPLRQKNIPYRQGQIPYNEPGLLEGPKPSPKAPTPPKEPTRKGLKPKGQAKPKKPNSEIEDAFSDMGKGITENLYKGIFESLEKGKDTFSGVRDPLIQKAKPHYEKGLIKSPEDLRVFVNEGIEVLQNKYKTPKGFSKENPKKGLKPKGQPKQKVDKKLPESLNTKKEPNIPSKKELSKLDKLTPKYKELKNKTNSLDEKLRTYERAGRWGNKQRAKVPESTLINQKKRLEKMLNDEAKLGKEIFELIDSYPEDIANELRSHYIWTNDYKYKIFKGGKK